MDVGQNNLQELVGDDGTGVSKAKEGVVCEDSGQGHGASVEDSLMAESTECTMSVHNADAFPDEDLPEDGESRDQGGQGHLVVERLHGEVVDLQINGERERERSERE